MYFPVAIDENAENGDEVKPTEYILIYTRQIWILAPGRVAHLVGHMAKAKVTAIKRYEASKTPVPVLNLYSDPIYDTYRPASWRALPLGSTGNVESCFSNQARKQPSNSRTSMSGAVNVTACVHRVSLPPNIASRVCFRFCEYLHHMAAITIDLLQ